MVDITKDEFWENKHEEITKKEKKKNKFIKSIKDNKWLVLLIISFLILAISNGLLIFDFFKIIRKL